MRLESQSCYVTVHVTGTSALDIANARTLKTAVKLIAEGGHTCLDYRLISSLFFLPFFCGYNTLYVEQCTTK